MNSIQICPVLFLLFPAYLPLLFEIASNRELRSAGRLSKPAAQRPQFGKIINEQAYSKLRINRKLNTGRGAGKKSS
jgi:hypothetical protein